MKLAVAYHRIASCIFLLDDAGYVLLTQWEDAEAEDLLLISVSWLPPGVSGICVVLANRLYRRTSSRVAPGSS